MVEIGIVTDEISRDLDVALEHASAWGLARFELREGSRGRFPDFTPEEVGRIDREIRAGAVITAVSPGIYKGHVEDERRWRREAGRTLPHAIEGARRFGCDVLIAFGFDACDDGRENRLRVLKAFEMAGEQAAGAGMRIALENEPGFWIDRPETTVSLLEELDHPVVRLNWDPANLLWGGGTPDDEAVERLKSYIINLHVKDVVPGDAGVPWRPLGEGAMPWPSLLPALLDAVSLTHVTLETHCEPLLENSRRSLDTLQSLLDLIHG